MSKFHWILFLLLSPISLVLAQDNVYNIQKTDQKINIDGILDEAVWQSASTAGEFKQYFPTDTMLAVSQTEIRLTYDDQFVYFSAKMYNQKSNRNYVVTSLRRDYQGNQTDGINLIFDTFQDKTNGFEFGVNAFGVQREGLVTGGFGGTSWSWDNKWYVEAKQYDGYWVAEGAIPFKTLRFKEGKDQWNISFYRVDSETGERSTWTAVPRNYDIKSLAFTGLLQWDRPLRKPGPNISIIPYVATDVKRDYEDTQEKKAIKNIATGGDAKIAIGAGLNLDLTVNPDFSQVEVDRQVTNLTRFELFFPEKRQFFLENADLFSDFGHPFYARAFFSRRVGIVNDTVNNRTVQNKILYGARLSGKLDNNWRIGLLSMQTERIESIHLPSFNYSVASIQRKVFARSNVGMTFVNKQSFDAKNDDPYYDPSRYNRVFGFDYNLASGDNKWRGKLMYQKSWDNENLSDSYAQAGWLLYRTRTWELEWAHTVVGENFNAEAGFVPRKGIYRIQNTAAYNFYPESSWINRHKLQIESEFFWRKNDATNDVMQKSDHNLEIRERVFLQNTGRIRLSFQQRYTYLFNSFDPTNTGGEELPANTGYTYNYSVFSYSSDSRRLFNYFVSGQAGQYFNGNRYRLSTGINYRMQPYVAINLNVNYNRIKMPEPYNSADLFLIGTRLDVTMTKKLFFTSFLQYNTQAENFNINSRLQWRFKPVSDVYIVYTDNYNTSSFEGDFTFGRKNRALVIKITYWLNI